MMPAPFRKFLATALSASCFGPLGWGQQQTIAPQVTSNILISTYTAPFVPPARLGNSARLRGLVQGGKLYLTAQDAIALALENNLDIESDRYNALIAQANLKRAQAGGALAGVPNAISQANSVTAGQGAAGAQQGAGINIPNGANGSGASNTAIQTIGSVVPSLDPVFQDTQSYAHLSQPQSNLTGSGITNLIHIFFKFVSIIVIAIFGWYMVDKSPEAATRIADNNLYSLTGVDVSTLISWTFANIGVGFSTQYVVQCISSLNSQKEARNASFIAGFALIPLGLMCTYIGIAARGVFPNIDPVMALPIFLTAMPSWLAGVSIMGIIAVTFVTILACQVGTTALVMSDFVIPLLKPNEKSKLRVTRIVCILVGLFALPFAMYAPSLLKTIFFARALRTSIAVLAIFMFFLPHIGSGRSAALGLVLSVIGTSLWFIMGDPFGIDNVYIAMLLPAIALCVDKLIVGKNNGKALTGSQI